MVAAASESGPCSALLSLLPAGAPGLDGFYLPVWWESTPLPGALRFWISSSLASSSWAPPGRAALTHRCGGGHRPCPGPCARSHLAIVPAEPLGAPRLGGFNPPAW